MSDFETGRVTKDPITLSVAAAVRRRRNELGLSGQRLADEYEAVANRHEPPLPSLSRVQLVHFEKGRRDLSVSELSVIAVALGVEPASLLPDMRLHLPEDEVERRQAEHQAAQEAMAAQRADDAAQADRFSAALAAGFRTEITDLRTQLAEALTRLQALQEGLDAQALGPSYTTPATESPTNI